MVPCIVNLFHSKPTRCNCSQSILFYCRITLHVSGVIHTHSQEYIKLYLQPPLQVILSFQLPSSNVAKSGLGSDSTSADGRKYGPTSARCNYSLHVLQMMDEGIIRNNVELSAENIIKLYRIAHCWTIIDTDSRCTESGT